MKACKNCKLLSEKDDRCSYCGETTSTRWQGYVIIRDPKRS